MNAQPSRRRPPGQAPAAAAEATQRLVDCVARMASGDERALAAFYDGTAAWVYGLILRIMRDSGRAEEVAADVYHQAWLRAGAYDRSRATPLGWILTIARSRAIDRLRSNANRASHEEPLGDVTERASEISLPDEGAILAERCQQVRQAVADLDASQAMLIERAFFGGESHREIAEALGIPLGTVKTRIRTGMQHLAARLRFLQGEV